MSEKRYSEEIERLRSSERLKRLEVEKVVSLCLQEYKPQRVLDVGTGSAVFAEAFARKGCTVAGVDVNPAMVAVARQVLPQADIREAVAEKLPFPDRTFDLVFMGHVLHEADDPLQALKEAGRVSRKGVAILEWPYRAEEIGPPLDHRLKPEEVEELIERSGFKNLKIISLQQMVLYLAK